MDYGVGPREFGDLTFPWLEMILREGRPVVSEVKMGKTVRGARQNFQRFMEKANAHGDY